MVCGSRSKLHAKNTLLLQWCTRIKKQLLFNRFCLDSCLLYFSLAVEMSININGRGVPWGELPCPQSCIILTWRPVGPDFRVSAHLFLILYPPLKAETPRQKPPFHVVAVDRQTSGSKMLINLTGSAGDAWCSDLKFRLMNWSTAMLSRWVRLLPI